MIGDGIDGPRRCVSRDVSPVRSSTGSSITAGRSTLGHGERRRSGITTAVVTPTVRQSPDGRQPARIITSRPDGELGRANGDRSAVDRGRPIRSRTHLRATTCGCRRPRSDTEGPAEGRRDGELGDGSAGGDPADLVRPSSANQRLPSRPAVMRRARCRPWGWRIVRVPAVVIRRSVSPPTP